MTHPEQPPGTADSFRSLDMFFVLPEWVQDPEMRAGYEILVANMQSEAQHLPMNTMQQLLIERIAHNYVVLRMRERVPINEPGGFQTASAQKDFNTFWLDMTKEFNKQVARMPKGERDMLVETLAGVVNRVIQSANLEDEVVASIKRQLRAELREANL